MSALKNFHQVAKTKLYYDAEVSNETFNKFPIFSIFFLGLVVDFFIMFALTPVCAYTEVNNYKFFILALWNFFIFAWAFRLVYMRTKFNPVPKLRARVVEERDEEG